MALEPPRQKFPAIGEGVPRYDAVAKVTGTATYGSDEHVVHAAHAFLLGSRIAKGRIRHLDLREAAALPGVIDILTYQTIGNDIQHLKHVFEGGAVSNSVLPMASSAIAHAGQPIAMVLAETYEVARDAAHRIVVDYEEVTPSAGFDSPGAVEQPLATQRKGFEDPRVGDFAKAYVEAPVRIDARYSTPAQHHNPMELFTVTCVWDGARLTVYEPSQNSYAKKFGLARQLAIDPAQIRVINPYCGGGFGSKGILTQRTAIVAVAARRIGRPVKLVPTREQGFFIATYRAETQHRLRLGASPDGRLLALSHEGFELTSRADPYAVAGTASSVRMYACPNIASKVTIVRADRSTPGFMRAPPEMPYFFVLESAMDELAIALKIDPVELRRINDTQTEPIAGLAYTSRSLMTCYDRAAEAFGWWSRKPEPGAMRDGDWLIGWGCATSTYPVAGAAAAARVRLSADGQAYVETAGHEIGQGMYTVLAQIAAEQLGIPVAAVIVTMGDTILPPAPTAAGSISTASVGSAIAKACAGIKARLGEDGNPATDALAVMRQRGMGSIEELGEWQPHGAPDGAVQALYRGGAWPIGGAGLADRIQFSFGAQFVEVRVHARTREIRVPRVVGAFAAGRILNARTARSQYLGGMIWGVSSALHEQTEVDPKTARFINTNFADYMIPVNADIGEVEVIMVPEEDMLVNPLGVKGIGEIGTVGTAAAVANALHHATGVRLRDLPLRLEHLIVQT